MLRDPDRDVLRSPDLDVLRNPDLGLRPNSGLEVLRNRKAKCAPGLAAVRSLQHSPGMCEEMWIVS